MDTADLEGKACIFVGFPTAYVVKDGKWYRIELDDPNPRISSGVDFVTHLRMADIRSKITYPADDYPFVGVRRRLKLERERAQVMSFVHSILELPRAENPLMQSCCRMVEKEIQEPEMYEYVRTRLLEGDHPLDAKPEGAHQVAFCAGATKLAALFQELQTLCENQPDRTYVSASELDDAVKKLVPGTAIVTASHAVARRHDGNWFMVRLENGLPVIRALYDAMDAGIWAKLWHMRALPFELEPSSIPTSVHEYDFVKDALTVRN